MVATFDMWSTGWKTGAGSSRFAGILSSEMTSFCLCFYVTCFYDGCILSLSLLQAQLCVSFFLFVFGLVLLLADFYMFFFHVLFIVRLTGSYVQKIFWFLWMNKSMLGYCIKFYKYLVDHLCPVSIPWYGSHCVYGTLRIL